MCSTTYVYTHVCGLLRTVCIPFSNLHHSVCNHNRIVGQRQRHPIQSNPIQFQTKPIHAKQTHCICLLIFVRLSVVTIWLLVCQVRFRSRTQRNSKYKNSNSRYCSLLIHTYSRTHLGEQKVTWTIVIIHIVVVVVVVFVILLLKRHSCNTFQSYQITFTEWESSRQAEINEQPANHPTDQYLIVTCVPSTHFFFVSLSLQDWCVCWYLISLEIELSIVCVCIQVE